MESDGTQCSHKGRHRHGRSDANVKDAAASDALIKGGKDRAAPDAHVNGTNGDYQQNSEDVGHQNTSSNETGMTEQRLDKSNGSYDNNRSTNEGISLPSSTFVPFTTRQGSARFESRPVSRAQSRLSRPGSRKTVSRASSRKSRPASSASRNKGGISDSESDVDDIKTKDSSSEMDLMSTDIMDDKAWDTDLEAEENNDDYDHTGKTSYLEACKRLGVVPASYFLRHMHNRYLDMKHHGLGSVGMKAIAISLVSNTDICRLGLQDNWLGYDGCLSICEMLKENCYITDLNLSDNKLGNQSAELFKNIIEQNATLSHVTLAGNDFDDSSAPWFAAAITGTSKLEYLNLSHNNLGEGAGLSLGPAISENLSLKHLDLSWNSIRRKGAIALAYGIKTNVFMKKINLSWNGFGLEGSLALGDALKGNSVLEELDITNNRITTEGAVLIGKGVAVNETLKVLKMGKNPMQSAGCYGICAAILRNPNSVMQHLDFSVHNTDILVNDDFKEMYRQLEEQYSGVHLIHGATEPPKKPKARVHPMVKLMKYIEKHNMRLVDFFNKFDTDHSMSVTREEFVQGIGQREKLVDSLQEIGIKLNDDEIELLLKELDRDMDGEINYSELVIGHTDFSEREKKSSMLISPIRATTDSEIYI